MTVSIACFALLGGQLIHLTAFPGPHYSGYETSISSKSVTLTADRGSIYDRNGTPLAESVQLSSVVADPVQVVNPDGESRLLSRVLGVARVGLKDSMIQGGQFVYLDRLISPTLAAKVQALVDKGELPGISLTTEETRLYPQAPYASPILGVTNSFGVGESGLEYQYNKELTGKNGHEVVSVTSTGVPLPDGVLSYHPAQPGSNLDLTIDSSLQYYVEQALAGEIEKSNALGGSAIVMDVQTGQILAMASLTANPLPGTVDPSNGVIPVGSQRSLPAEAWQNTALSQVYEPGSVAKIATITAALEQKIITPTTQLSVPDQILVAGQPYRDAENHPVQQMSPGQILGQSSNVGTIMIAQKLGLTSMTNSFIRYGWGVPTGLNFPGESRGFITTQPNWNGTTIGSAPIGLAEAVTPLQVLDSYNAIANGGVMVSPRLVDSVVGSNGVTTVPKERAPHRIESAKIAKEMTSLLENALAADGTAPLANVPGYTIAGKTGTSQKPYPYQSGYQPGAYMGTFVGYAPAQHPILSAIVQLDQPPADYGGLVAAPVFSQIMSYALQRYDVTPEGSSSRLPDGLYTPRAASSSTPSSPSGRASSTTAGGTSGSTTTTARTVTHLVPVGMTTGATPTSTTQPPVISSGLTPLSSHGTRTTTTFARIGR